MLGTPVPGKFCSFLMGGHDLMLWYRHLAKEMLELAQHYYDDITFTRFILQLTGACTIEEGRAGEPALTDGAHQANTT